MKRYIKSASYTIGTDWQPHTQGDYTLFIKPQTDYVDLIAIVDWDDKKCYAGYSQYGLAPSDVGADMETIADVLMDKLRYEFDEFFVDYLTPLDKETFDGKYGYGEFDISQYLISRKKANNLLDTF